MAEAQTCTNAVHRYLDRHVEGGGAERRALLAEGASWSYGELLDRVQRVGGALRAAGVGAGDRVLIVLPDCPAAVATLLAAMRVGAIPAPIHTALTDDEYAFICEDARPQALVTLATRVEQAQQLRRRTGWPRTIAVVDPAADAAADDGVLALDPLALPESPCDLAPVQPEDPALIQYTSGSTGRPKGVVHLHCGVQALPDGFGRRLALREDDICFSAAKLFFGYGLGNSVLFPLDAGAAAYLHAPPADPLAAFETIARVRPTVFFGGPTLYAAMLAIPEAERRFDLSSVRLYVSAGESLRAELFERWRERVGHEILDGLGSTECLHIFLAAEPGRLRAGSVGRPIPPYEVRLLDETGASARRGEVGRLEVRGPANGTRYWNRPEATRATMVDGWVRTGDLMLQDDDGMFRYVGRGDDVFKVRGMKVAPLEVEACLARHPAVAESAVVPRVDEHGITVAWAYVRLADGFLPTPELAREIRAGVRAALSVHKAPRQVEFVEALPRTSTGKLARYRLRAAPAAGAER